MSDDCFQQSVLHELREAFGSALVDRTASYVAHRVSQGLVTGSADNYLIAAVRNAAAGNGGGHRGAPATGSGGHGKAEPPRWRTFREDGSTFEGTEGVRSGVHSDLDGLVHHARAKLLTPAEVAGMVPALPRLANALCPDVLGQWRERTRMEHWQGAGSLAGKSATVYLASWGASWPWLREPEAWAERCRLWADLSGAEPAAEGPEAALAAVRALLYGT